MLQAMNTGHDGSMTTIHANTPQDAIARMETMALMANLSLSEKAIRRQIASAISIVIQVARFGDGTRRVTHISEITGSTDEAVTLADIFVYQQQGVSPEGRVLGEFVATGFRPKFAVKLKASGIALPSEMFEPARV
jgi:pilus assembly protein CpaF